MPEVTTGKLTHSLCLPPSPPPLVQTNSPLQLPSATKQPLWDTPLSTPGTGTIRLLISTFPVMAGSSVSQYGWSRNEQLQSMVVDFHATRVLHSGVTLWVPSGHFCQFWRFSCVVLHLVALCWHALALCFGGLCADCYVRKLCAGNCIACPFGQGGISYPLLIMGRCRCCEDEGAGCKQADHNNPPSHPTLPHPDQRSSESPE